MRANTKATLEKAKAQVVRPDRPVGAAATTMGKWLCLAFLLFLAVNLSRAENSLRWVTNFYTVTGATWGEIEDSINRSRPPALRPPLTGFTEWKISWQIAMVPSPGGCRCSSFTTRARIINTLPTWSPPADANPRLKQQWGKYFRQLAAHEAGHSQIALAALAEAHRQAEQVKEEANCDLLQQKINDLVNGVIAHHHKLEVDYDARTEHGAKQFAETKGGRQTEQPRSSGTASASK